MQSNSVLYNGQVVLKEHFRAFVYGKDNAKRLCNTYEDYQRALDSGMWFDSLQAVDIKSHKKSVTKKRMAYTADTFEVTDESNVEM